MLFHGEDPVDKGKFGEKEEAERDGESFKKEESGEERGETRLCSICVCLPVDILQEVSGEGLVFV